MISTSLPNPPQHSGFIIKKKNWKNRFFGESLRGGKMLLDAALKFLTSAFPKVKGKIGKQAATRFDLLQTTTK